MKNKKRYCCNLSGGVALIVWFTTNGMCVKNNTIHICGARPLHPGHSTISLHHRRGCNSIISTMNLAQREFLLCERSSFGLSTLLFGLGW